MAVSAYTHASFLYMNAFYKEATTSCCEAILNSEQKPEALALLVQCLTMQNKLAFHFKEPVEENDFYKQSAQLFEQGDYNGALKMSIAAMDEMNRCDAAFHLLKACLMQISRPQIAPSNAPPLSELNLSMVISNPLIEIPNLFKYIKQHEMVKKLNLTITYKTKDISESVWADVHEYLSPSLSELTIAGSRMEEPGATSMSLWFYTTTTLRKLNLSDSAYDRNSTDIIFSSLFDNRRVSLIDLDFSHNYICRSPCFLSWLSTASALQALNIQFRPL